MDLIKKRIIFSFIGVIIIASAFFKIPATIYLNGAIVFLAYTVGVMFLGVGITEKQEKTASNKNKKAKPIMPYAEVLKKAERDPKIKETINLLLSQKETDRLLGIKFINEIVKQNPIKYTEIAFSIYQTHIERFSKQKQIKEIQLIIDILFDREDNTYRSDSGINKSLLEIKNCDFSNISLENKLLEFALFDNCIFNKTNFRSSELKQSFFEDSIFTNVDFKNNQCEVDYYKCTFTDVIFSECKIGLLYIDEGILTNVDFSDLKNQAYAELTFDNCTMENVQCINNKQLDLSIYTSVAKKCNFSNSKYDIGGTFFESEFINCLFENSIFKEFEFENSKFTTISFKNSKLQESSFEEVNFIDVDFTNVDMEKVNFTDTDLSKVNFVKSRMDAHTSEQIKK